MTIVRIQFGTGNYMIITLESIDWILFWPHVSGIGSRFSYITRIHNDDIKDKYKYLTFQFHKKNRSQKANGFLKKHCFGACTVWYSYTVVVNQLHLNVIETNVCKLTECNQSWHLCHFTCHNKAIVFHKKNADGKKKRHVLHIFHQVYNINAESTLCLVLNH